MSTSYSSEQDASVHLYGHVLQSLDQLSTATTSLASKCERDPRGGSSLSNAGVKLTEAASQSIQCKKNFMDDKLQSLSVSFEVKQSLLEAAIFIERRARYDRQHGRDFSGQLQVAQSLECDNLLRLANQTSAYILPFTGEDIGDVTTLTMTSRQRTYLLQSINAAGSSCDTCRAEKKVCDYGKKWGLLPCSTCHDRACSAKYETQQAIASRMIAVLKVSAASKQVATGSAEGQGDQYDPIDFSRLSESIKSVEVNISWASDCYDKDFPPGNSLRRCRQATKELLELKDYMVEGLQKNGLSDVTARLETLHSSLVFKDALLVLRKCMKNAAPDLDEEKTSEVDSHFHDASQCLNDIANIIVQAGSNLQKRIEGTMGRDPKWISEVKCSECFPDAKCDLAKKGGWAKCTNCETTGATCGATFDVQLKTVRRASRLLVRYPPWTTAENVS